MRAVRNAQVVVLLLAVGAMAVGCAAQKSWLYRPQASAVAPSPVLNKTVAVPPFEDARPRFNRNMVMMYLIPLMPFGWQNFEQPEGALAHLNTGRWAFNPREDYAKAVASELASAQLFREAFFSPGGPGDADLVLQGKILATKYKGYMFTYGCSVEGPLLWFVGAPADWIKNEITVEMILKDSKSNQVLFQKPYTRMWSAVCWLYYLRSDFNYVKLFTDIMKEAVPDLEKALRAQAAGR